MKRSAVAVIALAFCASLHAARFDARECGVRFSLPSTWQAVVAPVDDEYEERSQGKVACMIALQPKGWEAAIAKSRWDASETPLTMVVYEPGTPFDAALGIEEFEKNGDVLGMRGGYGSFAPAVACRIGKLKGLSASTFFRGFIRDESLLREGESRVYSGEIGHFVLKVPGRRVISFECSGGNPDTRLDCGAPMKIIVKTLRFVPRKSVE